MITIPFKDQRSADGTRKQLQSLSSEIGVRLQSVFTSQKIGGVLKTREPKQKSSANNAFVYLFKCGLCDMDYVGYTNRHLHQRVAEHSSLNSSIGKHMHDTHGMSKTEFN